MKGERLANSDASARPTPMHTTPPCLIAGLPPGFMSSQIEVPPAWRARKILTTSPHLQRQLVRRGIHCFGDLHGVFIEKLAVNKGWGLRTLADLAGQLGRFQPEFKAFQKTFDQSKVTPKPLGIPPTIHAVPLFHLPLPRDAVKRQRSADSGH